MEVEYVKIVAEENKMTTLSLKSELTSIAKHLTSKSTYEDVMYELYVRMKISNGRRAADQGQVTSHEEVKRKFSDGDPRLSFTS